MNPTTRNTDWLEQGIAKISHDHETSWITNLCIKKFLIFTSKCRQNKDLSKEFLRDGSVLWVFDYSAIGFNNFYFIISKRFLIYVIFLQYLIIKYLPPFIWPAWNRTFFKFTQLLFRIDLPYMFGSPTWDYFPEHIFENCLISWLNLIKISVEVVIWS